MHRYYNNIGGIIVATLVFMPAQHATANDTTIVEKPRTASELMTRYHNTTYSCDGDMPAYMCSGVLLRVLDGYSKSYHAWDPSPFSVSSGATSFSYLRRDSKFGKLAFGYNSGLILYPQQSAPAGTLKITARCYFPIDSDTAKRGDSGCAAHDEFPSDSDSCDHYGITTADQWYVHYTATTSNRRRHECGMNLDAKVSTTQARDSFKLALEAQQKLDNEGFGTQNEFRLTTWASGIPKQLPIQAFFYLADTEGVSNARHFQKDFYEQAHKFVPVIRLTLPTSQETNAKFRFLIEDQAVNPDTVVTDSTTSTDNDNVTTYGTPHNGNTTADHGPIYVKTPPRRTALELSQQYYDTRDKCDDGSPAYMCSGVLIRSNKNYDSSYHIWDPSPFSIRTGAVSMSWLRRDANFERLSFDHNSGFILFPQQKAPAESYQIQARCYFLMDASSASRDNYGCGASTVEFPTTSDTCDHYDITTPEQWVAHYLSELNDHQHHQCGFDLTATTDVSAERFKVAKDARLQVGEKNFTELNEFRITTWPSGLGRTLPLQAFFYVANGNHLSSEDGRTDAQGYQRDYYNQTKGFMPIIRITLPKTASEDVNFRLFMEDQVIIPQTN